MNTVEPDIDPGFAVWITGLPASGKSALARSLVRALAFRGVDAAVLESDLLRRIFTPRPRYDEDEREVFYGAIAHVGRLLADHGVPVIFDATANRRLYRDRARREIARFLEVYVDTPLSVCISRDPKGIYRKAQAGAAASVPGLQAVYEAPLHPEVVMKGDQETPDRGAERVIAKLTELGFLKEKTKQEKFSAPSR